jgi:WXG100 family type VII secretion target
MAVTQAEAAVMAATASRFETVNAELGAMLRRLEHELGALRSGWQGAGGRSFHQVQLAWAEEQGRLQDALAETASAMRSAAGGYAAVDEAAVARFAPAGKPVISLPL